MRIEYIDTGESGLALVQQLWEKLNEHERKLSFHFEEYFAARSFARRKADILETCYSGALRVDLAKDADTGIIVGYCVSTVSQEKQGRIESIYVEPDYRRSGIGDKLMQRALYWMDEKNIVKKILIVVAGNEGVISFYRRYNFHPRFIQLEQRKGEGRR
jgi:diamine N-acetyltransferase